MTPEEIIQALGAPLPIWELDYKGPETGFECVFADGRSFTKRLNEVLPGAWSFRLANTRTDERGNISCEGLLTLHLPEGDRVYTSTGSERADGQRGDPKSDKCADTDAFKRACYRAGVLMYIYNLPAKREYTLAEIRRAARIAGYRGEIAWEHYGVVGKVKGPEPKSEEAIPPDQAAGQNGHAAPAANGAAGEEPAAPAADAYPLRGRFNDLCKQLQAAGGYKTKAAFEAKLKGSGLWPSTADDMPGILERLQAMLSRQNAETNGRGPTPDPFDWDKEYEAVLQAERARAA